MSKMVYQWKIPGVHKVDAAVAAAEINRLSLEGKSTPQGLVDASRPEDAPLHAEFEWEDSVAAEEWRKQQARVIYASVVYVHEDKEDAEPVRYAFKVSEVSPVYKPITYFTETVDGKASLLRQALKELRSFSKKYNMLQGELGKLFEVINDVEAKLAK